MQKKSDHFPLPCRRDIFINLLFLVTVFPLSLTVRTCVYPKLWMKVFLVVSKQCPRFIYVNTGSDGLGDQLERIFLALSVIYAHPSMNISLVVDDSFGSSSLLHYPLGYGSVLYNILNIPRQILMISHVRNFYRPAHVSMIGKYDFGSYLKKTKNFESDFPCNTMFEVDVYDSCKGNWCPFFYAEDMQIILKPILQETFVTCKTCIDVSKFTPLTPSLLNFVWHVRSGDVCYHCDNPKYYRDIYEFILSSFKKHTISIPPHQNIIVHQEKFTTHIPYLFYSIPHLVLYATENMENVVCTFIKADILISTGSSLPAILSWFTFSDRLVLIEDVRNVGNTKALYKYLGVANDTIRIDGSVFIGNSSRILVERLSYALNRVVR